MKKFLALMLLAGSSVAFGQFSIGISIGAPPPPRVIRVRPLAPGPGYLWVDGYWYPMNNRYVWHNGYYTRPPYEGAVWVTPRYESRQFYEGHWVAGERQFQHDHRWDRDKKYRDYDRGKGNNGNGKGNRR